MVNLWKFLPETGIFETELNSEEFPSLDAASQRLPAGVYTTFRTYSHDKVLRLHDHFDRLQTSADLQSVNFILDTPTIRNALRKIISNYSKIDLRVRIHWSLQGMEPIVHLMVEKFEPIPQTMYLAGVSVNTIQMGRINPLSKSTSFITETSKIRADKPFDIHEYLLIGESGEILEGMTSNVFFIENNQLHTATDGILQGITRQLVLEAASSLSIPIHGQGIKIQNLFHTEEIFITSASRGVLPVTKVNNQKIGSGIPGPMTQEISSAFEVKLGKELEII
jgi:branched-subunit amino acid aminotransferase/4-amino-4-deoxychorismate lyase